MSEQYRHSKSHYALMAEAPLTLKMASRKQLEAAATS